MIWTFFVAHSQEIFHQKITITEGLPSNSVYDIMQDDKGFIWFATDEGVSRFDGRHFKEFKSQNKSGKSGSFLKKDNFGRIWYENFDGYLNYVQNDSVYKINQGNPMGFINYSIYKNQLIYATQKGYEILDLKTFKIIKKQNLPNFRTCFIQNVAGKTSFFDPYLKTLTLNNTTLSSSSIHLNIPLVAPIFTTSSTIYCTDKSNTNKKMYKIENGKAIPLFEFNSSQTIQNLYFLQNKFWICTNKGLFVLNKDGTKWNEKPYFENFSITSFYIDNENKYWIGTLNDGVLRFSDFNEIQSDLKKIKPLLLSAEDSKLYVGSENGNLYSISNDFRNLKELPLKGKNQILYINNSHPKFNFIAADGMYKTNKNFEVLAHETYALKSIDFVNENEAIVAISGFIGFANIGNVISKSEVGNFQYKDKHYHLKDNIRGKSAIWNPIESEALFLTNMGLFSYKNNRLLELKLTNKKIGFRNIKKANNLIYVLTDDDKLHQYSHGNFTAIKTGLENITFFKSINNTLYLGTKNAVYVLKNNTIQKIEAIKITEKIQDLQINEHYFYVLNKQNIIRFNKNNRKPIQNKSSLYLEKFWVNNVDYTTKNKFNLRYYQNDLRLQVSMIDFSKTNSIFYRINNESWKEILNYGNILQLSSLSPNQYQIKFSTQKNGPILQKVNFEIQKPFWEKVWFFILLSFVITTLIIAIYYNRLKQITIKNNLIIDKLKLENYLSESRVKLIKAQMNPHFFFNALNTIQSYITTNETEEATNYLNKFSRLTRMILEMTDKNWITIEDELRMQTLYLDLQKVRLSDFDFQIEMNQKNISQITIPTMLLQPYIENAIIHGLAHKLGPKKLFLNFNIENNRLKISIKDNGIGIEKATKINRKNASKNTSFATKATLERLEIINRNECEISVETNEMLDTNKQSLGTEVKITMEIRYEL
ncbi:MAG: histidine kinase [Bacteroidota bacterium]